MLARNLKVEERRFNVLKLKDKKKCGIASESFLAFLRIMLMM
jgi:hypothetical protein